MDIARAPLVLALFLVMTSPLLVSAQTDPGPYDILITGGRIVDGTGNPWFSGDVAIRDDRIVAVGHLAEADATRVIDATGLVVAPGFIDLHTHSDGRLLDDGTAQSKVRQGVTLDVAGESSSQAPRDGLDTAGGGAGWTTFTGYFERLESEGIVLARASLPEVRRYEGMRVARIAESLGVDDPADVVIDLMAAEGGSISGVFHAMSEEDVRLIMRQSWVAHASDGSAINLDAPGVPHPRNYGTVPRVLGHYVREEGVLDLEDAVRKMTSLPEQILGLADRGQLRAGFVADVALFDPDGIAETNSFESPKSYPVGIPYVIVNGTLVIDGGEHTGARPGRALRGSGFQPGRSVSDGAGAS